jgi:outer membrane protein TolC
MSETMTRDARAPSAIRSGVSILALSLAGLALAGCVNTPRPTPDTRLPTAYEAPSGSAQADLDHWWTSFNDPQLTGLVETALEKAPDARTAAARLEEARAVRKGQVRQIYIPNTPLTGNAGRTHTEILDQTVPTGSFPFTQGGDSDSYNANFDVSWELDLFGRKRAGLGVVNNDFAAARFAYEGARASLAANVAQSYFEARGLAVQLDDARQTERINAALRDFATKKANAGLIATSEADRAEADLADTQARAANLEAQLGGARRSLLILVGRGVDPLASLPVDASLDTAPPVPATIPGELLARRPDVREAQARLASASGMLKINELALLPTFNITPGVGLSKSVSPSFGRRQRHEFDHQFGLDDRRQCLDPGAEHPGPAGRYRRPGRPHPAGRHRLREGGADRLWRGRERHAATGRRPAPRRPADRRRGPGRTRLRGQPQGLRPGPDRPDHHPAGRAVLAPVPRRLTTPGPTPCCTPSRPTRRSAAAGLPKIRFENSVSQVSSK